MNSLSSELGHTNNWSSIKDIQNDNNWRTFKTTFFNLFLILLLPVIFEKRQDLSIIH